MVVNHQQESYGQVVHVDHCIEFNVGAQIVAYPSLQVRSVLCVDGVRNLGRRGGWGERATLRGGGWLPRLGTTSFVSLCFQFLLLFFLMELHGPGPV